MAQEEAKSDFINFVYNLKVYSFTLNTMFDDLRDDEDGKRPEHNN